MLVIAMMSRLARLAVRSPVMALGEGALVVVTGVGIVIALDVPST